MLFFNCIRISRSWMSYNFLSCICLILINFDSVLYWHRLANFDDNNSTTEDSWTIMENLSDTVLTWDDVQWLKSITYLPVIVKGIMRGNLIKSF